MERMASRNTDLVSPFSEIRYRSGNPNKGAVNAVIYDGETSFWIAPSRFKKVGAARSYCDFEAGSTRYDDQLHCWSDDGFDRTWSLETFGQHTVEVMHNKNGIRLVN